MNRVIPISWRYYDEWFAAGQKPRCPMWTTEFEPTNVHPVEEVAYHEAIVVGDVTAFELVFN